MSSFDSSSLSWLELVNALAKLGWERQTEIPEVLSSWRLGSQEIVVPLDSKKGDYSYLFGRALARLESVEGGRALKALAQARVMSRGLFDVSKFLRESPVEGGIISWQDGRNLYDAAEQSILAAARSSRNPKKYHGNSSSYIAKNFLESSFMGQTEVGSFVVTLLMQPRENFLLSKADEDKAAQPSLVRTSTISGRQIVETFENALKATRTALDEYSSKPRLEMFDELVPIGVSAELLRALSVVSAGVEKSGVSIEFTAADDRGPRQTEVEFRASESPILERAYRRFLEDPDPQVATITGSVTLLDRPKPGSPGVVRVHVESGADIPNVRIRIPADNYNEVVDAFRDGNHLSATGQIERDGRYYWMVTATDLEVVAPPAGSEETDDLAQADGQLGLDFRGMEDEDDDE